MSENTNTLYISDLDGTLLTPEIRVSENSLQIINDLIDQGFPFTYATARSLVSASKVTAGLENKLPVIVYNGAFIMEPASGKILHSCYFTPEEQDYIQAMTGPCQVKPLVTAFIAGQEKMTWHSGHENESIQAYVASRPSDHRLNPVNSYQSLYEGEVFYYTFIGQQEELAPVYQIFKDDERFTCTFQKELYRPEYWLEIMPKKATKAEAAKQLKNILASERIVCFGDAINDLPLFQLSDEAYAMANAVPEVKACATAVIGSNMEDGVARWLQTNATISNIPK